jgi:hypothetical protein
LIDIITKLPLSVLSNLRVERIRIEADNWGRVYFSKSWLKTRVSS